MNRKRLLDSFALLAYLSKKPGFEKVRDALANAQKSGHFQHLLCDLRALKRQEGAGERIFQSDSFNNSLQDS